MRDEILCLHQSSELYGSDRSFLTAIESISAKKKIYCILPFLGELSPLVKNMGAEIEYYPHGILRKQKLKTPVSYGIELIKATLYYAKKYKEFNAIYINTTVMVSALLAAGFYRFSKKSFFCHIREIPDKKLIVVFRLLLRFSGAKLIFNSEATKAAFNLPGTVIYNGVAPLYSVPAMRTEKDRKNLLLIGRINTWKGQDFFIDVIGKIANSAGNDLHIRIVGSPFEGYEYLEKELIEKVNSYGISDNVEFFPFCSDPTEHFQWASYVVVPSTKPEPFGRVAIEAYSVGKPVIAAGHGGLVEIVNHEKDGFLFIPANQSSLEDVLLKLPPPSSPLYEKLSKCALDTYYKKFSLKSYKEHINSTLENSY